MSDSVDRRVHRVLAGVSRVRVLELLRARGGSLAAPEVAKMVGLHPNTVRLHLDQLAEAGLVTRQREPRLGPGRPRLLFAAVPVADAPPVPADSPQEDGYRVLAGVLAGHLQRESGDRVAVAAAQAGRSWARALEDRGPRPVPLMPAEARGRVVEVLDDLGFAPADTGPDGPIELRRCPFSRVAEEHSRVVCGVHLGLLQGLLDDVAGPAPTARLEPFVAPGLCLAHLDPGTGAAADDIPRRPGRGTPTPRIEGLRP